MCPDDQQLHIISYPCRKKKRFRFLFLHLCRKCLIVPVVINWLKQKSIFRLFYFKKTKTNCHSAVGIVFSVMRHRLPMLAEKLSSFFFSHMMHKPFSGPNSMIFLSDSEENIITFRLKRKIYYFKNILPIRSTVGVPFHEHTAAVSKTSERGNSFFVVFFNDRRIRTALKLSGIERCALASKDCSCFLFWGFKLYFCVRYAYPVCTLLSHIWGHERESNKPCISHFHQQHFTKKAMIVNSVGCKRAVADGPRFPKFNIFLENMRRT